ncbi:HET-domain-containing protein [Cubamyces sp. BRFM 1775]|nr:HET-domain-containing protein [Cubamyces sp. BRFM 1775]
MWLLDTLTLELCFHHVPPKDEQGKSTYAILSHVWDAGGEQSFQELRDIVAHPLAYTTSEQDSQVCSAWNDERISLKIRKCCSIAHSLGYRLVWMDSCCIDKTSSAELTEAINSMFQWYTQSDICLAYLADVEDAADDNPRGDNSLFRRSRWFTRGWTLQELIAPSEVLFFSRNWSIVGSKYDLADVIEATTSVDYAVLLHLVPLCDVSVARRMSWAAERVTTRVEDEAYALLGIFGLHMTTIYGEGRHAFRRLQEEIIRRIPDDTILAWGSSMVWRKQLHDICPSPETLTYHAPDGRCSSLTGSQSTCPIEGRSEIFATSPFAYRDCSHLSDRLRLVEGPRRGDGPTGSTSRRPILYTSERSDLAVTSAGVRARLPVLKLKLSNGRTVLLAFLACVAKKHLLVALVLHGEDPQHLWFDDTVMTEWGGVRRFYSILLVDPVVFKDHGLTGPGGCEIMDINIVAQPDFSSPPLFKPPAPLQALTVMVSQWSVDRLRLHAGFELDGYPSDAAPPLGLELPLSVETPIRGITFRDRSRPLRFSVSVGLCPTSKWHEEGFDPYGMTEEPRYLADVEIKFEQQRSATSDDHATWETTVVRVCLGQSSINVPTHIQVGQAMGRAICIFPDFYEGDARCLQLAIRPSHQSATSQLRGNSSIPPTVYALDIAVVDQTPAFEPYVTKASPVLVQV